MNKTYLNKEISWLSFNGRVLQEAADPTVPLAERLKFMGIFSSNLDEFFRVRVATLKRLSNLGNRAKKIIGENPKKVLRQIQEIVLEQSTEFDRLYGEILEELKKEQIFLVNESQLDAEQERYLRELFYKNIRPSLILLLIDQIGEFPVLKDHSIYLAVQMNEKGHEKNVHYGLIHVPDTKFSRFVMLPNKDDRKFIILLEDIIRLCLPDIFSSFEYEKFSAYTIKVTRDAELDFEDEFSKTYVEKIQDSLRKRRIGRPVRFIYDRDMPKPYLTYLVKKLGLGENDSLIPGGKYHNFKNFIKFPAIGREHLYYPAFVPQVHPGLSRQKSLLAAVKQQEVLLHFPYQTFSSFVDLLREAAIDPLVISIKLTIYRLARDSHIVNALVNAAKNGKKVTVVMELQARFDEAANLEWADMMREEGVRVIYGVSGLKVHPKVCLITRQEKKRMVHYCCIGTGNFNEDTAGLYTDHMLLTCDRRLSGDVVKLYDFFENKYRMANFRHLLVAPFQMRNKLKRLIRNEIRQAQAGKDAYILLKCNNLADQEMIGLLYEASRAGVKIRLIVRSMFSLIPGQKGLSENIQAISIVDRFLEHSRICIFANGGDEKIFIGSADWMGRNFDRRAEVMCPIYNVRLKKELRTYFEIQWRDNVKSRSWDLSEGTGTGRSGREAPFRCQQHLLDMFAASQNLAGD